MLKLCAHDQCIALDKDTGAYLWLTSGRYTLYYGGQKFYWKREKHTDLEVLALAQVTLDKLTGHHVQEDY